jgi:exopolysaccharide biosynthesis polyprenyl glycosylphosphotransferase
LAWHRKYQRMLIAIDLVAVTVAVFSTISLRFGTEETMPGLTGVTYGVIAPLLVAAWMWMLSVGLSRSRELIGAGIKEYQRVVLASLWVFGQAAIVSFLLKAELSRMIFVTTLPLGIALLMTGRWIARKWLARKHTSGAYLTPTLIVGRAPDLADLSGDKQNLLFAGYGINAVCVLGEEPAEDSEAWYADLPRFRFDAVAAEAAKGTFSAVIITNGLDRRQTRRFAWQLEPYPVELLLRTNLTDVAGPRITVHTVEGVSLTRVDLPRFGGWQFALKRFADVVFSLAVLILLSPMYAIIALLVKLQDGGPVIFKQQRVGVNGKLFTMHKFRTMVPNAEELRAELEHLNEKDGPLFKITQDPRVTRVGRVLRKYSLDEFPQFWTVLKGDMSVVGPRPPLPSEVEQYSPAHQRRLLIKPGITGLWQVSGRSELSWDESTRLDLQYVENWSLLGDLILVIKTVVVMFTGRGAA